MPKPHPKEAVTTPSRWPRKGEAPLTQIAKDFRNLGVAA